VTEPIFRIEMLPAAHGDALLVEYGVGETRRMMIDGGPLRAYDDIARRLDALPERGVELLVVTHVDTDHVEGVIRMLAAEKRNWLVRPREVWFNGWRHLSTQTLGGREGEFMGALLRLRLPDRWNTRFDGNAVCVDPAAPRRVPLEGGMTLTLLSPDAGQLLKLREHWKANCEKWNLPTGRLKAALEQLASERKFSAGLGNLGPDDLTPELLAEIKRTDRAVANGSSIAFLAEFGGKSCLFLADAHMGVVCDSLERLGHSKDEPLRVDAVKLSHHGSKRNLTRDFLELVDAQNYLVSTNGDIHQHPDYEAIEAIISGARRQPTLWFNYRSPTTVRDWEARSHLVGAKFSTRYPLPGSAGIVVNL